MNLQHQVRTAGRATTASSLERRSGSASTSRSRSRSGTRVVVRLAGAANPKTSRRRRRDILENRADLLVCQARQSGNEESKGSPSSEEEREREVPSHPLLGKVREFFFGAPRVRFRTQRQKKVEQLAELVVLNEKLKYWEQEEQQKQKDKNHAAAAKKGITWYGGYEDEGAEKDSAELSYIDCRRKVEFLKTKKQNWESIYDSVSSHETEATLMDVEGMVSKVSSVLSDKNQDKISVTDAADQLLALQEELEQAHERIHLSQARLGFLSDRLNELRSEATLYEDCQDKCEIEEITGGKYITSSYDFDSEDESVDGVSPSRGSAPYPPLSDPLSLFHQGVDSETNTWYPVCLSQSLQTQEDIVTFDLKGVPWVLFMDNQGEIACVRDECSHRACPLSLGKVNKKTGAIQCAYHGWEYNRKGHCIEMPSTNVSNTAKMNLEALHVSKSRDGILWVTNQKNRGKNDNQKEEEEEEKPSPLALGPPTLTDLEQNDCLVEAFVDKIPVKAENIVDVFTIGGFPLASEMYARIVDFAFRRPLGLGFALDAMAESEVIDYELKFLSFYAFKIDLFGKDGSGGQRPRMTMVFSFVPETAESTNLIFQLYRQRAEEADGGRGRSRTNAGKSNNPLDFLVKGAKDQWAQHIHLEISNVLKSFSEKNLTAVKVSTISSSS